MSVGLGIPSSSRSHHLSLQGPNHNCAARWVTRVIELSRAERRWTEGVPLGKSLGRHGFGSSHSCARSLASRRLRRRSHSLAPALFAIGRQHLAAPVSVTGGPSRGRDLPSGLVPGSRGADPLEDEPSLGTPRARSLGLSFPIGGSSPPPPPSFGPAWWSGPRS